MKVRLTEMIGGDNESEPHGNDCGENESVSHGND